MRSSKFKVQSSKVQCKIQVFYFILALLPFIFYLLPCYAQSVSSTELINNAKQYDGKTVVYEGEVIGDVMQRADFAWINVNDGVNAIGVWMNASLAKEINYTGSYKSIGDRVEITGIFHRACPEHGGDLDIHAQLMRKIAGGRQIQERLNTQKRNLSVALLGILILVWILSRLKRK